MEVWLLDLGTLYAKQESIICRGRPQDTSRIHLPVMAVLVRHSGGILLFDTGCRPDAMTGGWPANMREAFPLTRTSEQALTHQLSLCGISPSQVDTVVLSHLHLDHAGNAGLFPHARLIVPAEDLEYARRLIENADPARRGGYIREDILELPGKMTALVQDRQLFPGIRLLGLPGHTPALLGMEIAANYGPPPVSPRSPYDKSLLLQSLERVRQLAARPGAQVIFSHDIDLWQQLPHAPIPVLSE